MTRATILVLAFGLQFLAQAAHAQQRCATLASLLTASKSAADRPAEDAKAGQGAAAAPQSAPGSDTDLTTVPFAQWELLNGVVRKLAQSAQLRPTVVVCADDRINAFAAETPRGTFVGIDLALLNLLKFDANAIAFVLSHEIAHLVLGHTRMAGRRQAQASEAVAEGVAAGMEYERQSGRRGAGILVARQAIVGRLAAFSRTQERDADDTGYQLMVMAGFEPAGALTAAKLMEITAGNQPTEFFSSHPGWPERVGRLEQVAKVDLEKRESTRKAEAQRASDQQNIDYAERLLSTGSWKELAPFIRSWHQASPESGAAWYYYGLLLRRLKASPVKTIDAFESSVKFDPRNANAWYELCSLLHENGYRRASAHCGRDMQGSGLYGEFNSNHYRDRLFSHGHETIIPPPMWLGKDARGATLITNDEATRRNWNIPPEGLPPARRVLERD